MTRKLAIETAMDHFDEATLQEMDQYPRLEHSFEIRDSARNVANRAYDLGRIKGLRMAAKMSWLKEESVQLKVKADRLEKKASKNRGK